MAANKYDGGIIYKCPLCFETYNDVPMKTYEDGKYHCVKCGYVGTEEEVRAKYAEYRSRYKFIATRLTLEDQRKM